MQSKKKRVKERIWEDVRERCSDINDLIAGQPRGTCPRMNFMHPSLVHNGWKTDCTFKVIPPGTFRMIFSRTVHLNDDDGDEDDDNDDNDDNDDTFDEKTPMQLSITVGDYGKHAANFNMSHFMIWSVFIDGYDLNTLLKQAGTNVSRPYTAYWGSLTVKRLPIINNFSFVATMNEVTARRILMMYAIRENVIERSVLFVKNHFEKLPGDARDANSEVSKMLYACVRDYLERPMASNGDEMQLESDDEQNSAPRGTFLTWPTFWHFQKALANKRYKSRITHQAERCRILNTLGTLLDQVCDEEQTDELIRTRNLYVTEFNGQMFGDKRVAITVTPWAGGRPQTTFVIEDFDVSIEEALRTQPSTDEQGAWLVALSERRLIVDETLRVCNTRDSVLSRCNKTESKLGLSYVDYDTRREIHHGVYHHKEYVLLKVHTFGALVKVLAHSTALLGDIFSAMQESEPAMRTDMNWRECVVYAEDLPGAVDMPLTATIVRGLPGVLELTSSNRNLYALNPDWLTDEKRDFLSLFGTNYRTIEFVHSSAETHVKEQEAKGVNPFEDEED